VGRSSTIRLTCSTPFDVLNDFVVPEANDAVTHRGQFSRTRHIFSLPPASSPPSSSRTSLPARLWAKLRCRRWGHSAPYSGAGARLSVLQHDQGVHRLHALT
jgi:hypothetical protein